LLSVHMVASEVELVQDLVVLAMVAALTTVALQAQTFLTNSLSFDREPLVRLDWDKRLFHVKAGPSLSRINIFKTIDTIGKISHISV